MKKMFKKHNLVKITTLAVLLTAILTWIIPTGYFSGTEFVSTDIARIGIKDLFLSGVYSINYFLYQILFLLALGGFYAVLSKIGGYKKLVEKLTQSIKGKETVFILIVSFIFALLASLSTEIYHLIIFVPFIITILLNAKLDKITAFGATFGAILIGVIGATYGGAGTSYIYGTLGLTAKTEILIKIVIFFITYVLFSFFTILKARKTLNSKKSVIEEDTFELTGETKKAKIWPIVTLFAIIFIVHAIAYIPWADVFGIEMFNKAHTWHTEFTAGSHPIFSYILGETLAIGKWDLFSSVILLIVITFIFKFIGKIKFDEYLNTLAEGAKKMLKPALLVMLVNVVFILVYWSNIVPTMVNFITGLTNSFNIFTTSLAGLVSALFHTDYGYTGFSMGSYFAAAYTENTSIIAVALNAMNGFVQFFAPTSVILMAGLAYLNIPYKDWMKHIWKFLLGILICLLLIFTLVVYL